MTNVDSILKSRDLTLPTKVHIVKAMVFPIVTYGCETWTIKKAKCRRIDAFKLVLEKTLESPLDNKEFRPVNPKRNQPWIFTGGTAAESSIFWPPDGRSLLIRKDPDAGKDWVQEEKGMRWLDGITDSKDMSLSKLQEMVRTGKPGMLQSKELDKTATEQQQLTTNFPRSGKFYMFTFLVFAKCKSYQMQTHPKYFST